MAKVLVCADGFFRVFSPMGLEPYIDGFIQSLVQNGNDVMTYISSDFKTKHLVKKSILDYKSTREMKKFSPDLIIAFNNAMNGDFLKHTDCPVLIIASDTPVYWSNKEELLKNPSRYSVLFFNADMSNELKNTYKIPLERQILIPYTTSIYADKTLKQDKDISFIGNFYEVDVFLYNLFFKKIKKQSPDNLKKLKILICEMADELQKFKYPNEKTYKTYTDLMNFLQRDDVSYEKVISCMLNALTSNRRQHLLSSMCDMDLHIFTWNANFASVVNNYTLFRKCHLEPCFSITDNQVVYHAGLGFVNAGCGGPSQIKPTLELVNLGKDPIKLTCSLIKNNEVTFGSDLCPVHFQI